MVDTYYKVNSRGKEWYASGQRWTDRWGKLVSCTVHSPCKQAQADQCEAGETGLDGANNSPFITTVNCGLGFWKLKVPKITCLKNNNQFQEYLQCPKAKTPGKFPPYALDQESQRFLVNLRAWRQAGTSANDMCVLKDPQMLPQFQQNVAASNKSCGWVKELGENGFTKLRLSRVSNFTSS